MYLSAVCWTPSASSTIVLSVSDPLVMFSSNWEPIFCVYFMKSIKLFTSTESWLRLAIVYQLHLSPGDIEKKQVVKKLPLIPLVSVSSVRGIPIRNASNWRELNKHSGFFNPNDQTVVTLSASLGSALSTGMDSSRNKARFASLINSD